MRKLLVTIVAFISVAVLFVSSAISVSPAAHAAKNISFSSTKVTPKNPCQNATVTYTAKVLSTKKKALAGASVTIKVYYKSTTTSYTVGKTNGSGIVTKTFKIGRATPDYTVKVISKATKGSYLTTTTTQFKPKRCS